jgi:hypothetical protein
MDLCVLASVGIVTIYALFPSMQQVRQRMLVVHVGRFHHRAMRQTALAVHANVQLHVKVPRLAFSGLVHLGVACLVCIPGRGWCGNDRPVLSVMPLACSTRRASAYKALHAASSYSESQMPGNPKSQHEALKRVSERIQAGLNEGKTRFWSKP